MTETKFIVRIGVLTLFMFFIQGCGKVDYMEATRNDLNHYSIALASNNWTLCYSFDPLLKKSCTWGYTECFNLRESCFYNIAIQTKNPQLCEELIYLGEEKENEGHPDENTTIVTTKGVFEAFKKSCIEEASS